MAAKKSKESRKAAQSKSDSKPASKRGGRRVGAGRKTTEQIKARQDLNAAVDEVIGVMALDLVGNLKRLADGRYERVTETMELAATVMREELAAIVMREEVARDELGRPRLDGEGNAIVVQVAAFPDARPNERVQLPVFPNAKPGEMVVVKRVVEVADGDRAANEYLLNRRLGKPKQALELSGPDGTAIPVSFEAAIDKIYGEVDDDGDDAAG